MKVIDYLSCPNCGNSLTGGELCNLGCRREMVEKQQTEARAAKHARNPKRTRHQSEEIAEERYVAFMFYFLDATTAGACHGSTIAPSWTAQGQQVRRNYPMG